MKKEEKEVKTPKIKSNQSETKDLNDKQKDRLYKNAAIMGLLRTKKIMWEDLITSNGNIASKKNELEKTLVSTNNVHYIIILCITLCYTFYIYIIYSETIILNIRKNISHLTSAWNRIQRYN